ncbi:MAG: lysophospholipid acyltransferase family protein [Actinomycetota bacterium]
MPDLPERCLAALPGPSSCSEKAMTGHSFCEKHVGPLVHDKPSTPAEFLRRWKDSAEGLLKGQSTDAPYDTRLVETLLPLALPLYNWYFRMHVTGLENIPTEGPALLACNHSGAIPIDGAMLKIAVLHEHGRNPWLLAADLAFRFPGFGTLLRKAGNARASRDETLSLLRQGEMIGVFPEGFKGIGKGWSKRYKLQRFGRGGFVEVAVETGAPIIPVAIIGAEESYPMIARFPAVAKKLGLPYVPVTPFFPALGPLGLIPLPSKWIIAFGQPVSTIELGPESIEDTQMILETSEYIRHTIQDMIKEQLVKRGKAFL